MTQHELIIEYIKRNGSILPAKLSDNDRRFMGDFIGSEAAKRCREMRNMIKGKWVNPYKKQMVESRKDGRFERFYLLGAAPQGASFTAYPKLSHCCYSYMKFKTHGSECPLKVNTEPIKELNALF